MTTLTADAPATPKTSAAQLGVRTVLVHVEGDPAAAPRLATAADLARRFGATLFGLGAEMVPPLAVSDPTGLMQGEWYVEMRAQLERNLDRARESFQAAAVGMDAQWSSIEDMPSDAIARAARAGDLIVAGGAPLDGRDGYRACDTAALVLKSGRPVLIAPPKGGLLEGKAVVLAWKDTREARRALADALPFLAAAEMVLVVEVCPADEAQEAQEAERRIASVRDGLKRHGITAHGRVIKSAPERVVADLNVAAQAVGADLIVAGGYGHTRMGEWVFGGVTRELLRHPDRFVLLSH